MGLGLALVIAAAICSGTASVLEAVGARRVAAGGGLDVRVVLHALRQLPYVGGLLLDGAGFVLSVAALRFLPLFLVQAAMAASLAVTAAAGGLMLRIRLRHREWTAVGGVCAGLAMLGAAARTQGPAHVGAAFHLALLGAALVLVGAAAWIAGGHGPRGARRGAIGLGLITGLGTGLVSISARIIDAGSPAALAADPACYALIVAGLLAFVCFTIALQRGGVTAITAASVVAETIVPTVIGVALLGDRSRPGLAGLAVAGFVIAVAGALLLARFGDVDRYATPAPAGDTAPDAERTGG